MMTKQQGFARNRSTRLLSLTIVLAAAGCRFDGSGLAPDAFHIWCDVPVWDCPKTSTPPAFTFSGSHPNISKYLKQDNFWKLKDAAYQVYWNPPVFVVNPGPDVLPGCTLVATGADGETAVVEVVVAD